MNAHILNPDSPCRRWKANRRKRPEYPVLKPGERAMMHREECGINKPLTTPEMIKSGKVPQTMRHTFIFEREVVA